MEMLEMHNAGGDRTSIPRGSTAGEAIQALFPGINSRGIACARVNGRLRDLGTPLTCDSLLEPVPLDSPEGDQAARRTQCFLLFAASRGVFPDRKLRISHALGDGYWFRFEGSDADREDLAPLSAGMERLRNLAIRVESRSWSDAVEAFRSAGRDDTVMLLEDQHEDEVPVHCLEGFMDLDHGPLLQDLSCLPVWHLCLRDKGFVFGPRAHVAPQEYRSIHRVYQEYEGWGRVLGVSSAGQLNRLGRDKTVKEFIWTAEALHQQKISELARDIADRHKRPRLVLIAGPSSSGKTTFAKKLSIQLRVMGFQPVALSLDDYFLPRDLTPRDEEGNYDFESLQALDVPLLNRQLLKLFQGDTVDAPAFDFKSGQRIEAHHPLHLPQEGILVIEGIHGINDELTPLIPPELKYRIFASALTQLNIDSMNRISTTDNRLLRRMVRDKRYRGYGAKETLERWPSVRRGENRNIFPFQESADAIFNSALDYELGVLRTYAEPLLKTVEPVAPVYAEARRLLQFTQAFLPIPSELVPDNSILREFIGGSAFKY